MKRQRASAKTPAEMLPAITEIGADGFPTDPAHPSNRAAKISREEWITRRGVELLATMERAWRAGVTLAVADAVAICRSHNLPPPEWLVQAVGKLANERMSDQQWRQRRANMIHYARWDAVKELRERRHELSNHPQRRRESKRPLSWEDCWSMVAESFEGTEAGGSAETIRKSYQFVEKEFREERGGQFTILDPRIDETSSSVTRSRKRPG